MIDGWSERCCPREETICARNIVATKLEILLQQNFPPSPFPVQLNAESESLKLKCWSSLLSSSLFLPFSIHQHQCPIYKWICLIWQFALICRKNEKPKLILKLWWLTMTYEEVLEEIDNLPFNGYKPLQVSLCSIFKVHFLKRPVLRIHWCVQSSTGHTSLSRVEHKQPPVSVSVPVSSSSAAIRHLSSPSIVTLSSSRIFALIFVSDISCHVRAMSVFLYLLCPYSNNC